jgi:serine/threonine protein kinase/tetratricopeptide (TPR) repeat protein
MVGTRLGQYLIEAHLGAGGMGVVYRAMDTRLERRVAIKVIPDAGDKARTRLLREARSASALNHPNVCTIYEVGELGQTTYLVMEYLEGPTLGSIVPPGGLSTERVATYGSQVAEALAHAHARGIVHRDLKGANVVVADGRAKVLDFGLAAREFAGNQDAEPTRTGNSLQAPGVIAGTLAYMAPETLRGAPVNAAIDIWALGVLLYEIASGRRPFEGQTTYELSGRILHDPPRALPDTVPQALRDVILRCLAKNPGERHPGARDVAAALAPFAAGAPHPSSSTTSTAMVMPAGMPAVLVLPFVNVAADPETDFFSDGLTDELITDLSVVKQLRVISRTSSMQLKGSTRSLADLAREMRVGHVLEGTVRRSGIHLRVTAKLVDPATDSPIWADKYSGTLDDVFQIQETISRSIVSALKVHLTADEDRRLAARPIADARAYDWYLRARQELLLFTEDSLARALEYLKQADAIVGENVLLLAATGTAYWQYINAGISADPAFLDKAATCAERILQIDPASPHGHRLAGLVRVHRADVRGSLLALSRALAVDPNDTDSLMWGSLVAAMSGKSSRAAKWARHLVDIDPVTPFYQLVPGTVAWMRGDFEVARAAYDAHEAAVAETPALRLVYGQILAATGHKVEGLAVLEQLAVALPENSFGQLAVAYRHAFEGSREGVEATLTPDLISVLEGDPQYCWFLAHCYALVGCVDAGIGWVRAAADRGFINYPMLAEIDPFLASLRHDPRYVALMADVERHWRALDV